MFFISTTILWPKFAKKQARKPRSYASLKIRPTHRPTDQLTSLLWPWAYPEFEFLSISVFIFVFVFALEHRCLCMPVAWAGQWWCPLQPRSCVSCPGPREELACFTMGYFATDGWVVNPSLSTVTQLNPSCWLCTMGYVTMGYVTRARWHQLPTLTHSALCTLGYLEKEVGQWPTRDCVPPLKHHPTSSWWFPMIVNGFHPQNRTREL